MFLVTHFLACIDELFPHLFFKCQLPAHHWTATSQSLSTSTSVNQIKPIINIHTSLKNYESQGYGSWELHFFSMVFICLWNFKLKYHIIFKKFKYKKNNKGQSLKITEQSQSLDGWKDKWMDVAKTYQGSHCHSPLVNISKNWLTKIPLSENSWRNLPSNFKRQ